MTRWTAKGAGVGDLEIRVLGPLEVRRDGDVLDIAGRRERALLTALAVQAGSSMSTAALTELLWSHDPPRTAAKTLQGYVSRLRRWLGGGGIDRRESGYRLVLDPAAVDAHRFGRLVAEARGHDAGARASLLREALSLWRGDLPAELGDTPAAAAIRDSLTEARLAALEELAEADLAAGRDASLVAELERLVTAHPFRERLWAALMLALYRAGRQADALHAFGRARARLDEELGLAPSDALRELEHRILTQDPSLAAPAPSGAGRQVVGLPAEPSSLVGRDQDVAALHAVLGRARLVTVTGPGGVGKTRLAIHVAAVDAERRPDGVWLVDLAATTEAAAVGHAIADALGVQPQPGAPIAQALADMLRHRRALLLLDNCEHLVDPVREVSHVLVRRCPDVVILATSRRPLGLAGEHVYELRPLGTDDGDSAGVRLFCERALAVDPGFDTGRHRTVATRICRRLDGLPLAIELAAARVRALAPADIATRLDQRFGLLETGPAATGRRAGLRATLDWSHDLLDDQERVVLRRAAAFAGSFDLEAAEAVCAGGPIDPVRVADVVGRLAEQSLLGADAGRYRMLRTVRSYMETHLEAAGETEATRRAHARHYVELAERLAAQRRASDEPEAVRRLDVELANLRAAHAWARRQGEADLALRLSVALHWFAYFGMRSELFEWADAAAETFAMSGHPLAAEVLGSAAVGRMQHGDQDGAVRLARRARGLAGGAGSVLASYAVGQLAFHAGRFDEAAACADEIDRLEPDGYASLLWRGLRPGMLAYQGRREDAFERYAEVAAHYEATGNPSLRVWGLYGRGEILSELDPDRASALLREAVDVAGGAGNRLLANVASVTLSSLAGRFGDAADALDAFDQIVARWQEQGAWMHQWTTLRSLVELLARVGRLADAVTLYEAGSASRMAPPLYGEQGARLANLLDELGASLGPDALERASRRGAALSDDEAVAFAQEAIAAAQEQLR